MGLRESILSAVDLPREPVEAWGQTVWVRTLTGAEKDAFEDQSTETPRAGLPRVVKGNFRGRLAALCCCDEGGQRLFRDEDADLLGRTSALELEKVIRVAGRLNGLGAGDLERAEKNSAPTRNGASGSS